MAISTFSPVGSLSSNGLRMRRVRVLVYIARNQLIREYASVVHSVHTHTHTHTHTHCDTHILIPFGNHNPTGLKVDIAKRVSMRLRMNQQKLHTNYSTYIDHHVSVLTTSASSK